MARCVGSSELIGELVTHENLGKYGNGDKDGIK